MHVSYVNLYTVELLLRETPNKGHLYKEQALWSLQDHGNTILPLREDNLSITIKLAGPKCPLFRSFTVYTVDYYIMYYFSRYHSA